MSGVVDWDVQEDVTKVIRRELFDFCIQNRYRKTAVYFIIVSHFPNLESLRIIALFLDNTLTFNQNDSNKQLLKCAKSISELLFALTSYDEEKCLINCRSKRSQRSLEQK